LQRIKALGDEFDDTGVVESFQNVSLKV